MKNKKKNNPRDIFLCGEKTKILKIALPAFALAALFCFGFQALANSSKVIINEIQISGGVGKSAHDYIELYNNSDKAIDVGGWQLKKRTTKTDKSGATESSIKEFPEGLIIPSHGYFLWANSSADLGGVASDVSNSATIAANNSIALFDADKNIIDQVAWGVGHIDPFIEKSAFFIPIGKPERIERKNFKDSDDNAEDFEVVSAPSPTPSGCLDDPSNEKCLIKKDPPPVVEYSDGVLINEIYPNPKEGEEEFIELYNSSDEKIELKDWIIRDASKAGKYVFSKEKIESKGFLEIKKTKFKFALNNSGNERVTLLDPGGEEVSRVDYEGSKKGISYSFDGKDWRWTKFLTPSEENKFEDLPKGTLKKDEKVYVNAYAYFSIQGLSKKAKITWDFGDGHKSYIQKTKHKYKKTGKYDASVKFSEGSEDVIREFTVEVKKYPHPKVKIVSISPNPVGKDSELETITIKNDSKKKINLLGWSVATGWKKLINHPIREGFEIKPGKERVLTRELSAFSLNNKKQKIELRYPDGEVADKVKYKNEKSIEEGVIYKKEKGKKWEWKSVQIDEDVQIVQDERDDQAEQFQQLEQIELLDVGKKSEIEVEDVFEKTEKLSMINFPKKDLSKPLVLGANALWVDESGLYRFIYESSESDHYAIAFAKNISSSLNSKLNFLFNYFSK